MKLLRNSYVIILLTILVTGCAGTDFVRVSDNTLNLGSTTEQDIRNQMGSPYREGVVTKNDQQFNLLNYAYASTGGESLYEGVTPARGQTFIFKNNILMGHEFVSSWKIDNTDFDEKKMSQIKKNVSKKSDVIAILGKPSGKYVYPLSENKNGETLGYFYAHTAGSAFNLKFFHKTLLVELDNEGIVTKVDYTQSGNK